MSSLNNTSISPAQNVTLTTTTSPPFQPPLKQLTLEDFLNLYWEYRWSQNLGKYGYPTLIILGTIGNLLIFLIMIKPAMRKSSTSLYMAILAIFDTLVLFFGCLRQWLALLNDSWDALTLNHGACKILNFLTYSCFDVAVWILVAMTIERYIAIHFPLKAAKFATKSRAKKVLVCLVFGLLVINCHFFWTVATDDRGRCNYLEPYGEFHDKIWPWIDATLYSFLPFLALVIFNTLIIYDNRKYLIRRNTLNIHRKTAKQSRAGFHYRLSLMLLSVTFAFLILSAPRMIFICIRGIYFNFTNGNVDFQRIALYSLLSTIMNVCLYLNHTLNFFLYCVSGQRFRKELIRLFKCEWGIKTRRSRTMSSSDGLRLSSTRFSDISQSISTYANPVSEMDVESYM